MIHEIEILMKIAPSLKVTCQHCSYSTYTFNLRFLILKLGFQNLKLWCQKEYISIRHL